MRPKVSSIVRHYDTVELNRSLAKSGDTHDHHKFTYDLVCSFVLEHPLFSCSDFITETALETICEDLMDRHPFLDDPDLAPAVTQALKDCNL